MVRSFRHKGLQRLFQHDDDSKLPSDMVARISLILSTLHAAQERKDYAMEMKNPVHPGLLVKECLDDLGLTVAEAAAALHITRQQLHNIVAGRSGVTPEMAIRFEKAFGSTADTWLRMQMNYDLAQVRQRAAEIVVERLTPKVA
jgi:addiction module HigA family antidote